MALLIASALPKVSEGFDTLAEAVTCMRPQPESGQLTVSVAPSFAARWLMPRLHRFFAAQPDLDVRISARTRLLNKRGDDNAVERATVENWLEEAAGDALGVVATFPELAVAELTAGRLILPFELHVPVQSAYYLVCEETAALRPAVAAFRDWLLAEAVQQAAY